MSTVELRKKLINKIKETKNEGILQEAYRLLGMETEEFEVYELNDTQRKAINQGREQIKNGESLTNEQANSEIDEWLKR